MLFFDFLLNLISLFFNLQLELKYILLIYYICRAGWPAFDKYRKIITISVPIYSYYKKFEIYRANSDPDELAKVFRPRKILCKKTTFFRELYYFSKYFSNIKTNILENSIDYKKIWISTRANLESDRYKYRSSGKRSKSRWSLFAKLLNIFVFWLKVFNLYKLGVKNAKNIHINKFALEFPNLPEKFDGYKLLHLSDLHLDTLPGIEDIIIEKIQNLKYDLCVLTGDYRKNTLGSFMQIINPLKKIVSAKKPNDGIIGIFGNHDTYLMLKQFEKMGITLLTNESITINKGNDKITITGLDDPFYYYTDQAVNALEENIKGFKIVLVHTSEMYKTAEQNGYDLYLCGHTHGGQICLPGGIPIITHQFEGKKFYKGLWNFKSMKGYTSQGCGTSGIPIRFYSQSEITLFTLKKREI